MNSLHGEPAGEGHVAEIGFVDRSRMVGEKAGEPCGHVDLLQTDCLMDEYPATADRFIGPNLSLHFAIFGTFIPI